MNHVESPASQQRGTVLIVDDDMDALRLTQRTIANLCPHLGIRCVRSGGELLDYLKGEQVYCDRTQFPYPMLVLLDLTMPGMHGFEVLTWLATHPPYNRVPVVVLTGSGEVLVAQQAYALGARSFLTKPLNSNELKHTMDMLGKFKTAEAPGDASLGKSPINP
jgi:CheY-like chemotaxis protein